MHFYIRNATIKKKPLNCTRHHFTRHEQSWRRMFFFNSLLVGLKINNSYIDEEFIFRSWVISTWFGLSWFDLTWNGCNVTHHITRANCRNLMTLDQLYFSWATWKFTCTNNLHEGMSSTTVAISFLVFCDENYMKKATRNGRLISKFYFITFL